MLDSRLSLAALLMAGLLPLGAVHAEPSKQFNFEDAFAIRDGDGSAGDRYAFTGRIDVDGRHEGDLIGFAESISIDGEVDGDLFLFGNQIRVDGNVRDSVRIFGNMLTIDGTIEGDLIVFGNQVDLGPDAHVTGNVVLCGARSVIGGTIDGGLRVMGGEARLRGTVGGDAEITVDTFKAAPEARIGGNLVYSARKPAQLEGTAIVSGTVEFNPKVKKDEKETSTRILPTGGELLWWAWKMLAAMLVGLVAVALSRRAVPATLRPIAEQPMIGAIVGFVTFLVVPAACVLAMVLLISLPLGVLTLTLYVVALYLAKMPVALWLGRKVLGLVGRPDPSPFASLALGIFCLYVLFLLPFKAGSLVWLAVTWLGLGAMIQACRAHYQARYTAEP